MLIARGANIPNGLRERYSPEPRGVSNTYNPARLSFRVAGFSSSKFGNLSVVPEVPTAKRFNNKAQGRAAHPGLRRRRRFQTPTGFYKKPRQKLFPIVKPLWGLVGMDGFEPRVRCATLGFVVKPLRGRDFRKRRRIPRLGTTGIRKNSVSSFPD
jgi:hypothetical protein